MATLTFGPLFKAHLLIKLDSPKHCDDDDDDIDVLCDIKNTRYGTRFREHIVHVCVVPSGRNLLSVNLRQDENHENAIPTAFSRPTAGKNGSAHQATNVKKNPTPRYIPISRPK